MGNNSKKSLIEHFDKNLLNNIKFPIFKNFNSPVEFKNIRKSLESLQNIFKSINIVKEKQEEIEKTVSKIQPIINLPFHNNFDYNFLEKECIVCLELKRNRIEPVILYEGNNDKCIFHCEKTDGIWRKRHSFSGKNLDWDERALKLFYDKFYDYITFIKNSNHEDIDFREAIFPEFIFYFGYTARNVDFSGFSTDEKIVENYYNCDNSKPLILSNKVFIFENTDFFGRFEIGNIDIKGFNFKNCLFQDNLTILNCESNIFDFFNCKVENSLYLVCNTINRGSIIDTSIAQKIYIKSLRGNERFSLNEIKIKEIHLKELEKDYTGGFYPEVNINNINIEKGIFVSDNKIKKLTLEDIYNRNIRIEIIRNLVDILEIISIDNIDNSLKVINIQVDKLLNIKNSTLTSFEFRNCDFSKCKIEITNSSIANSIFSNVNFGQLSKNRICESLFINKKFLEAKEIFRQLKANLDEQKDYITANEFYALEMRAYENYLKHQGWSKNNWQERLIFTIHKWASNFGQSWI